MKEFFSKLNNASVKIPPREHYLQGVLVPPPRTSCATQIMTFFNHPNLENYFVRDLMP